MSESPLIKVACPSCGAPLLFGPNDGDTTTCQFCGAVVERPASPGRKPEPHPPGQAPETPAAPPAVPDPVSRPNCLAGLLLSTVVAGGLIVGVVAVFFALVPSSTLGGIIPISPLAMTGPVALLPVGQTQSPDFISLTYDSGADKYLIARLNPASHRIAWRGKTFEDISDVTAVAAAAAGDKFFTVESSSLFAYNAADGAPLWQAALSDKLGYCAECLSVSGNRVITLTQDYVLSAFDADAGESVWQRRMDGYTKGFTIADGAVWVIDKVGGQNSLLLLSLKDGKVQRQITAMCQGEQDYSKSPLQSGSTFLLDPSPAVDTSNRSVYLLYGWSPGCVEHWTAPFTAMDWQTSQKDGYSPSQDFSTLSTSGTLFFSAGNNLWAADKETGKVQVVSENGDYNLVPQALEQGVLIVRAKRNRGTEQFGLWGVDPASGKTLWQYVIDKGAPIEPPDDIAGLVDNDQSAFAWRIIGGQVVLMVFRASPNQLIFQTVNPKDGTVTAGKIIKLNISGDFYAPPTVVAWQDPVVWVLVESKLLGIDAAAMSVKFSYP